MAAASSLILEDGSNGSHFPGRDQEWGFLVCSCRHWCFSTAICSGLHLIHKVPSQATLSLPFLFQLSFRKDSQSLR